MATSMAAHRFVVVGDNAIGGEGFSMTVRREIRMVTGPAFMDVVEGFSGAVSAPSGVGTSDDVDAAEIRSVFDQDAPGFQLAADVAGEE